MAVKQEKVKLEKTVLVSHVDQAEKYVPGKENDPCTEHVYLNRIPFAIFRYTIDGDFVAVNERACRETGYSFSELCTMSLFDIHKDITQDKFREIWLSAEDGSVRFNSVCRKKDGTSFPVEVMASRVQIHGISNGVNIVCAMSGRSFFNEKECLSGIAHDLNNVLGMITGYASVIRNRLNQKTAGFDKEVLHYIDHIQTANRRACYLVKQLASIGNRHSEERELTDLGLLIREEIELIKAATPSNIKICADVPENMGKVWADRTQIHQLLLNLCVNACQAMGNESGALTICLQPVDRFSPELSSFQPFHSGDYIKLMVSDTGPGITKADLSHIFEPYFTTKSGDAGTGLGLAVVYRVVRNHGGEIVVDSKLGVGTEFQIFLPIGSEGGGKDPSLQQEDDPVKENRFDEVSGDDQAQGSERSV